MVVRLSGALAAIAAAALLIAGLVTSAWWTGHGEHGGGADVSIGLREAARCFIRHEANGKPRCTATTTTTTDCDASEEYHCDTKGTVAVSTAFGVMGWGASVLGGLAALVLAIAGGIAFARGRAEAKGAASAGATIAMIAGAAGGAFVMMRPTLKDFDVQLAWSAYAFLGGAAAAVAAAALLRREPRVVHAHAPAGPVRVAPAMQVDVAAMFEEEARRASATSAAAALASLDEPPEPGEPPPSDKTDPSFAPPTARPAPPPAPLAARVPSENRADTEKDLPPDDMQGTPSPAVKPAPPPPVRAKAASLPPLPLPRTKPPSLPPPARPPATPSGTGPAPRIAAPEPSIARPAARPAAPPPPVAASAAGPVPACPQCDAPTIWNEEHLRFFCRSCRIYL